MPTSFNQTVTIGTSSAVTTVKAAGKVAAITTTSALSLPARLPTGGTLTQNMTVAPSASEAWKWVRTLLQKIGVHQTDAQQLTYHATLAQVVHLSQFFARVVPVTLNQNMTVHQASALKIAVRLLQNLTVQMSNAPVGTVVLSLRENITLSPAQALHAVYSGTLSDEIEMAVIHTSPGGTTTTWVVNTRTNAVTEYTNYNFNSYAQRGIKYIAANSTGVYELDGDSDNGTRINSDVISAFTQLNGGKLSGLKNIYLAIRGGGQFFIKIIQGDGREYIYEALGQPGLMTTKVNVGKGLRSTYTAFELTSTGQDFDLDSLTFIPMLSDRRV